MAICGPEVFGADPVNIKWNVVRGDTATLLIQFFENDETTYYDTSLWDYVSTAYDPQTGTSDELEVEPGAGYATITAPAYITENWGVGSEKLVANLKFDLQVITENDDTWTPVVGQIVVMSDVTGGNF
jgi:hypothetical protein